MKPILKKLAASTFIGKRLEMSFAENKTGQLWGSFMPRRRLIKEVEGIANYSIECYPEGFFKGFNPNLVFEKWAAVKVKATSTVPYGMEKLEVRAGLYAVFLYKGTVAGIGAFCEKIYTKWLPAAGYTLDHRPHFAVMDERYKNNHSESEEELWIPIKAI